LGPFSAQLQKAYMDSESLKIS